MSQGDFQPFAFVTTNTIAVCVLADGGQRGSRPHPHAVPGLPDRLPRLPEGNGPAESQTSFCHFEQSETGKPAQLV